MSAMDQMLANMIKNLLPPEVMEMLSPEKLQEFGAQVNAFIETQTDFQNFAREKLVSIEEKLDGRNNHTDGSGTSAKSPGKRSSSGSDNGQ